MLRATLHVTAILMLSGLTPACAQHRDALPGCLSSLPASVASDVCSVLARYVRADSSGALWLDEISLEPLIGEREILLSNGAAVVGSAVVCGSRVRGDTVVVQVLYSSLGRVAIDRIDGRWEFSPSPSWEVVPYRVVRGETGWRIRLLQDPDFRIGWRAVLERSGSLGRASLRRSLARAAREVSLQVKSRILCRS